MNNFNRNTRTLILSFVVAVFALIPLRFIEVGQKQEYFAPSQVLGEKIEDKIESKSLLEAPYDELERCITQKEIEEIKNDIYLNYVAGNISEEEFEIFLVGIEAESERACE